MNVKLEGWTELVTLLGAFLFATWLCSMVFGEGHLWQGLHRAQLATPGNLAFPTPHTPLSDPGRAAVRPPPESRLIPLGDDAYVLEYADDGCSNCNEIGFPQITSTSHGFWVSGIQPDTLWAQADFRSGDVLVRVNGETLDSPARALELNREFGKASRIVVDVERAGKIVQKVFYLHALPHTP